LGALKFIDAQTADDCADKAALQADMTQAHDAAVGHQGSDSETGKFRQAYGTLAVYAEQHPSCFDQRSRAALEAGYKDIDQKVAVAS
jgi:hypothetical protein